MVFTNNCIELRNKCDELEICFLGELPYLIDDYVGERVYTEEDIIALSEAISDSAESNEYEVEMDMQKFKEDFARVLVTLENYDEQQADEEVSVQEERIEIPYFLTKKYADNQKKIKNNVGAVTSLILVASISTVVIKAVTKSRK